MSLEPSVPPINVYEGSGQLSVVVPIPGAHPQHVEVVLTSESMRLRAECKYPQESQRYHRRDWQVGAWEADVPLPHRVDPVRSRATLNLGVLVVMAPLSAGGNGGEHRLPVL
ncbi:MAG: Hsp20/alpha crystallin family protein [Chloroflexi bacterium]|nr:MAG: Hsp20/alpha crystallin family protein [Chloroflexota bacterium]